MGNGRCHRTEYWRCVHGCEALAAARRSEDIFAADVIEGRFRRLRERPASQEAMAEMFRRWHLVEVFKSQGHELKAAVSLAAEELRCSESAVRGAIRAIQEAQANGGEIQVKDPCASNRHLIVRKQIANIAGP